MPYLAQILDCAQTPSVEMLHTLAGVGSGALTEMQGQDTEIISGIDMALVHQVMCLQGHQEIGESLP